MILILCNELNWKQPHWHEYILLMHKRGGKTAKPSTEIPSLSFSCGKQLFSLRGVWWWRHQALFVLLKLKGPCKVFGPPYPLSLWPHHAQTWRTSHQSKGWDLWQLGKKPPFPRRQMCDVSQCLWTSWSLELLTGERCFSEVAARGARAVKETEYATSTETNESVPFSGDRRYHTKSSDWKWKYMITNHMARR